MEMSRDNAKKVKNLLIWKRHVIMTEKNSYIINEMQLQSHFLIFFRENKSLLSATSILSRSPLAYNTTASFDNLTFTDYVDLGKCQDRFWQISWSKNSSNYLDKKFNLFKTGDNQEVQNFTMGEANFNQFMRFRNQLVNAAKKIARDENLTPVLIPTMSKDMDEQIELANKVVDVVNRANRKICVTLLPYNVDKSESSYAQVRLFARRKEDEKIQQVVYVNYKLEEFIYILDLMNSVSEKVII